MKKEYEEIERKFAGMPRLQGFFKEYERRIANYDKYEWKEGVTKEKMIKKRDTLMEIAEELSFKDLLIHYYLKKINTFGWFMLKEKLQKVYAAECELKKLFLPNEDFEDVIALCDDTWDTISKKGKKS